MSKNDDTVISGKKLWNLNYYTYKEIPWNGHRQMFPEELAFIPANLYARADVGITQGLVPDSFCSGEYTNPMVSIRFSPMKPLISDHGPFLGHRGPAVVSICGYNFSFPVFQPHDHMVQLLDICTDYHQDFFIWHSKTYRDILVELDSIGSLL